MLPIIGIIDTFILFCGLQVLNSLNFNLIHRLGLGQHIFTADADPSKRFMNKVSDSSGKPSVTALKKYYVNMIKMQYSEYSELLSDKQ